MFSTHGLLFKYSFSICSFCFVLKFWVQKYIFYAHHYTIKKYLYTYIQMKLIFLGSLNILNKNRGNKNKNLLMNSYSFTTEKFERIL